MVSYIEVPCGNEEVKSKGVRKGEARGGGHRGDSPCKLAAAVVLHRKSPLLQNAPVGNNEAIRGPQTDRASHADPEFLSVG